jgi:hypothetical protein
LGELIKDVKRKLDREWKIEGSRLYLAPGEEILNAVFNVFGTDYKKTTDARRIAKFMDVSDFHDELGNLMAKIEKLTQRDGNI